MINLMDRTGSQTKSPADSQAPAEFTWQAVLLGILLSVVMGAANVYLGLRAGMTVSASIPAAVVATGILRGVLRRRSLLEANLVQTSASAGESLAAGIIFTMPALIMVGLWESFDYWTTTLIALAGGMLGVLLMIPMRRVFVVEDKELQFPEGVACAEVLRAGDTGATGTSDVMIGLAIGAALKLATSYFELLRESVSRAVFARGHVFYFGSDISPALLAVGTIVGLSISVQIFLGGAIGWLIAIPMFSVDPTSGTANDVAYDLWSTQVRYIGVGAMLVGGVVSVWRVRGGLVRAVRELSDQLRGTTDGRDNEQSRDIPGIAILLLGLLSLGITAVVYFQALEGDVSITLLAMLAMAVMAFFFSAVASYIVGLVGNSNSPVSGMTITAVWLTGLLIWACGYTGPSAMMATLGVAGVVCCVACTSGDVCNDLKTGHLVGASPRRQQIMQIIGVAVAAFVMAPVMTILHEGSIRAGKGGLGSADLPAPQAGLFASLVEGFFGDKQLPWTMVEIGVGLALGLLAIDRLLALRNSTFRLHVMPVAVGIYLPLSLSVPILLGGLVNFAVAARHRKRDKQHRLSALKRAVLIASGMIAGESLLGVGLGVIRFVGWSPPNLGHYATESLGVPPWTLEAMSVAAVLAIMAWIVGRKVLAN